jgi:hypothetical protein
MNRKIPLNELLETSTGASLLFLGREALFTHEEIARFLKPYGISLVTEQQEGVVASIEHSRLNPIEEEISNGLYEQGIPSYTLESLEILLSQNINDDALLMALKLSNNQARIFRLLANPHLSETLFLKLLMMYAWHEEEEDDRDDRDVIMYTLRRYIQIGLNEEDLLYSYITLHRLAIEARHPQLLLALMGFPNYSFVVRGSQRVTLQETVASNAYIDEAVIQKLWAKNEPAVQRALAANPAVKLPLLYTLLEQNAEPIDEALATHPTLDASLFKALLQRSDKTVQLLLLTQTITQERFEYIEDASLSVGLFATLGANETLSPELEHRLVQLEEPSLFAHLAQNPSVSEKILVMLHAKKSYHEALATNPSAPSEMLEALYVETPSQALYQALAANPNTPSQILTELFERGDLHIHQGLASNGSIPLEILERLKIDTRLQTQLAKNPIMKQWYQSVLDYDKNAGQLS